jgi:hypothetical protein
MITIPRRVVVTGFATLPLAAQSLQRLVRPCPCESPTAAFPPVPHESLLTCETLCIT